MGFFYSEQKRPPRPKVGSIRSGSPKSLGKTRKVISIVDPSVAAKGCVACTLDKEPLEHPKMKPTGTDQPLGYILGEAPGKIEDEDGEQFVGKAGQLLRRHIPRKFLEYLRWNNTLRCRPPDNREPSPLESACCRQYQVADIEETKPRVIIGFGDVPLHWATGKNDLRIGIWRGRRLPVKIGSHTCWYYPIFHPAFFLHQQKRGQNDQLQTFADDVRAALDACVDEDLPEPYVEPEEEYLRGVHCLEHPTLRELRTWLEEVRSWDRPGFDVETNGLRPYFLDRRILTMSFSSYEKTVAFPFEHPGHDWGDDFDAMRGMVFETLCSVTKVSQNTKFEQEWCLEEFGEDVLWEGGWEDSFAQAYILDSRKGAKSLGDLTLLHLGFDVKALSTVNVKNLISEPLSKVLSYNGLDSKYCKAVFHVQEEALRGEGLWEVYEEQVRMGRALVLAQAAGVVPNDPEIAKLDQQLTTKIAKLDALFPTNKDVQRYQKAGKEFKPTSNPVLLDFFTKHLDYKILNVDEEALGRVNHEAARWVLERRGHAKLLSTYVLPIATEKEGRARGHNRHEDSLIHTNYNHCYTSTRRLSDDDPNLQNYPKHKHKEIRAVVRSPDGTWLVCFDYGQIEARVIAMASKDAFLVKALWENYDIHMEWMERVVKCCPEFLDIIAQDFSVDPQDKKLLMKTGRQVIKNNWVFPLFFGSVLDSVAENLKLDPDKLSPEYDRFWNTFDGVGQWQEREVDFYEEQGYVETMNGFRRRAPVGYNELINLKIQGTTAEIVADAFCRLSELAHKLAKPQYQFRLQVHDDLGFYLPDRSLEEDIEFIGRELCLCKRFAHFINVPITVEVTAGRDWHEQTEVAIFRSTDYGFPKVPSFAYQAAA